MNTDIKTLFEIATRCHGIRATIDRFDDAFDDMTHDNSFNWCDDRCHPIYEIRHDKNKDVFFIWIAANQNCDPRCDTYYDENCVIFLNCDDFCDFIDQTSTPVDDE